MENPITAHHQIGCTSLTTHQRSSLTFHGFICIGIGLLGGMAWVIVLGGYLELWPIPPIEFSLPETKELWRNAHIGPIMNGMFVLAIASISPLLTLGARQIKFFYIASILMVWCNTIGYQISPFASDRGLAATGDVLNVICYFFFYIAALCAIGVVGLGIYGSRKTILLQK